MTISIKHNDIDFEFRSPNDLDAIWIFENYSTDGKPNGGDNHKRILGDFDNNYQECMQATTQLMYRLNLNNFTSVQNFINLFGTTVKDCALLYHTMQKCLGGTQEDIDIHLKYIKESKLLKRQNLSLKIKVKGLEMKIKALHKKKRKK